MPNRIRGFRPGLFLALMLSIGLVLGACGSSDKASGSGGGTIKIGTINAIGTKFNNDPARVAAVKAAAQAINKRGGIDGKKIDVIFCNNGNEPNKALACAQQLVKEKAIACVGCENDFNGGDVADLLNKAGIPEVEPIAIYPQEWNLPTSYLTTGNADYQIAATGMLAHDVLKAKTWALAVGKYATSAVYDTHIKAATEKFGMKQLAKVEIPLDAANYDAYAAKIVAAKPDVVISPTTPQQTIPLVKAIESQGFHPNYVMNADTIRNDDFKEYGAASSRIYVVGDVPPLSAANDYPQIKQYIDQLAAYKAKSGDTAGADLGQSRMSSIRVWLSMQFIAEVLKGHDGTVTAKTLVDALNSAKDLKSDLIPPWTPNTKNCLKGYARVSNPNVLYMKVENQQMVLIDKTPHDVNQYLCG